MAEITDARRAELVAMLRKCDAEMTPGEWEESGCAVYIPFPHKPGKRAGIVCTAPQNIHSNELPRRDAAGIATLRNMIPDLLSLLDRPASEPASDTPDSFLHDEVKPDPAPTSPTAERCEQAAVSEPDQCDMFADMLQRMIDAGVDAGKNTLAIAVDQIRAAAAWGRQLPEGMRHCTIRFKECEKGHGWLTADNWVQHSCPTCERKKAEQERDAARERVAELWDRLDHANRILATAKAGREISWVTVQMHLDQSAALLASTQAGEGEK